MDYTPKKIMNDDVLWFLRVLICDVFKFTFVIVLLKILLIFHGTMHLVQLYYFLTEPQLFAKYGPHFIGDFYAMAASATIVWKKHLVDTMWDKMERWDISSAGRDQEMAIQKDVRQILIFVAINTTIGFVAGVLVAIPADYDEDFFLLVFVAFRWFPPLRNYSAPFRLCYKLSLVALCFTMMIYPFLVIYAVQHIKFQLGMTGRFVSGIDHGRIGQVANSSEYQEVVGDRLKFCIKRCTEIMKWGHSFRRDLVDPPLFVTFVVCGFFLLFSIIFTLMELNHYGNNKLLIAWEILFAVVVFRSFLSLILSGELIQDEVEKIRRRFASLKWYDWNEENRKLLMMAEGSFIVPFKLRLSRRYAVNYDLSVAMLKGLYTITSVILTARH